MSETVIPQHQWTHDGDEVLIVRFCAKDGTSSHGFRYPLTVGATVEAPDWTTTPACGGGLHGWPWGFSLGSGAAPEWSATWLVIGARPADVVDLGGKVKIRAGVVRYVGDWHGATAHVLAGQMAWVHQAARGAASTAGDQAPASTAGPWAPASTAGDQAPASTAGPWAPASTAGLWAPASTAGPWAPASTAGLWAPASTAGYRAPASTAGDQAPASTAGDQAPASTAGYLAPASTAGYQAPASTAGYQAPASTAGYQAPASAVGSCAAAVCCGLDGRARAGEFGVIALAFWNTDAKRAEMRCARIGGEGGLKPHVWYRLNDDGEFVEDK